MNVLIYGINGKMGKVIKDVLLDSKDFNLVGGISRDVLLIDNNFVFKSLDDVCDVDLIIDFSNPCNLEKILNYSIKNKIALVIGTTNYTKEDFLMIKDASRHIPIFYSENYSLGIYSILKSLKIYSKFLTDYDVDILEKHHKEKKDAPSGTALRIRDEINRIINKEINISSIRSSNIVGEHIILFSHDDEEIEIKHKITSKRVFALGVLKACKFVLSKNYGLFSMDDLVGDLSEYS